MKIKNKKDLALGIGTLLVSAWVFYLCSGLPEPMYEGDPGPKMFPMVGAVIMAICGIVILIKPDKNPKQFMTPKQWKSAGVIFCVYLLCVLLFWLVGFMITVPIILFILTFMMSAQSRPNDSVKKRLIQSIIYAIIAGALVYVAYVIGLQAKLPTGIIFK